MTKKNFGLNIYIFFVPNITDKLIKNKLRILKIKDRNHIRIQELLFFVRIFFF